MTPNHYPMEKYVDDATPKSLSHGKMADPPKKKSNLVPLSQPSF